MYNNNSSNNALTNLNFPTNPAVNTSSGGNLNSQMANSTNMNLLGMFANSGNSMGQGNTPFFPNPQNPQTLQNMQNMQNTSNNRILNIAQQQRMFEMQQQMMLNQQNSAANQHKLSIPGMNVPFGGNGSVSQRQAQAILNSQNLEMNKNFLQSLTPEMKSVLLKQLQQQKQAQMQAQFLQQQQLLANSNRMAQMQKKNQKIRKPQATTAPHQHSINDQRLAQLPATSKSALGRFETSANAANPLAPESRNEASASENGSPKKVPPTDTLHSVLQTRKASVASSSKSPSAAGPSDATAETPDENESRSNDRDLGLFQFLPKDRVKAMSKVNPAIVYDLLDSNQLLVRMLSMAQCYKLLQTPPIDELMKRLHDNLAFLAAAADSIKIPNYKVPDIPWLGPVPVPQRLSLILRRSMLFLDDADMLDRRYVYGFRSSENISEQFMRKPSPPDAEIEFAPKLVINSLDSLLPPPSAASGIRSSSDYDGRLGTGKQLHVSSTAHVKRPRFDDLAYEPSNGPVPKKRGRKAKIARRGRVGRPPNSMLASHQSLLHVQDPVLPTRVLPARQAAAQSQAKTDATSDSDSDFKLNEDEADEDAEYLESGSD